ELQLAGAIHLRAADRASRRDADRCGCALRQLRREPTEPQLSAAARQIRRADDGRDVHLLLPSHDADPGGAPDDPGRDAEVALRQVNMIPRRTAGRLSLLVCAIPGLALA